MRGGRSGWFAGPQGPPAAVGAGPGAAALRRGLACDPGGRAGTAASPLSSLLLSPPCAGPPRFVGLCGFGEKACVVISVLPNLEKAEFRISQEIQLFASFVHLLMLVFPELPHKERVEVTVYST